MSAYAPIPDLYPDGKNSKYIPSGIYGSEYLPAITSLAIVLGSLWSFLV
jgi:hypothetical protein